MQEIRGVQEIYRSEKAPTFPIPIIYEDNHLLVAIKSPGLLSQEDFTMRPDILNLLKDFLVEKYNKPGNAWLGLVHRLDQPVGGLMVFAKTSKAASRLSDQLRKRNIKRYYTAIIHGNLEEKDGTFQDKISKDKKQGRYYIDKFNGRESTLDYKVVAYDKKNNLTLVNINLISGRSHQIRVQFASRSYPLVGDRRYGLNTPLDLETDSPSLFAYRLELKHPTKGLNLGFQAELPQELPWIYFKE